MLLLSRLKNLARATSKRLGTRHLKEASAAPDPAATPSEIKNLQDLLKDRANSHGAVPISIYSSTELTTPREITYLSLLEEATERSKSIQALEGFEVGKPVLLHFDDHWNNILWFWSVLLADGLPVLSSPLSNVAESRAKHLQHLSALLESPLAFTTSELLPLFESEHDLQIHTVESIDNNKKKKKTSTNNGQIPESKCSKDDLAILMLTSGSTGHAKAVRLRHTQLLQSAKGKASVRQLPNKPFLNWIGLDHVAGLTEIHLKALWLGMPQIHVQASDIMASPSMFLDLVSRQQVTRTFAPNFFLAKLAATVGDLQKSNPDVGASWDFSNLLILGSGGEGNDTETCTAITDILVKHGAPRNALMPGFGMTETCAGSIYNLDCPAYDVQQSHAFATLGKCMPGIQMRIASESGASSVLPPGTIGFLEVSGPVVFDGYYRNPDATLQAFTPDGWFRTGDQAHINANGNLNLVGRAKDVININGVKFGISDLQSSLEQAMGSSVSRLIVFPSWIAKSGTEQVTVAYIPLSTSPWPISPEQIVDFHDIMNKVCFMSTGSPVSAFPLPDEKLLPKTTLGKISKPQMKSLYEKGIFDEYINLSNAAITSHKSQQSHELPASEGESFLLNEIAQIANLDASNISVTTPIFDLGFSSLDLIRLKKAATSYFKLGGILPLLTILKNPTARSLASALSPSTTSTVTNSPSSSSNNNNNNMNNNKTKKAESYDPVVPLRLPSPPNNSQQQQQQQKPPLWLIHPGVGEILVFLPLAQALPCSSSADYDNRAIYALRARGFEPEEQNGFGFPPFESIEETVSCYVSAIRKVQPKGPYAIAGYSYGGMLAFEVAKVLEAGGGGTGGGTEVGGGEEDDDDDEEEEEEEEKGKNSVPFLGILNLPPHIKSRMRYLADFPSLCLLNLAYFLSLITEPLAEELEPEFRSLSLKGFPHQAAVSKIVSLADERRMEELGLTEKQLADWAVLASKLQGMARDYEPRGKIRSGGIDVFHAVPLRGLVGSREEWVSEWLRPWEGFCEGGGGEGEGGNVKFHEVGGAHYTMLGPEFVEGFAETLRGVLRDRGV